MQNPFKFLREPEWQSLMQTSEQKKFNEDDVLLKEGQKPNGIIIISSGEVKVARDHSGFQIELSTHGPGEIFGEMSFIEAEPANTNVIAKSPVEILYITHAQVQSLIRENPGFFGRFYQSLAYILSQRLRDTTGQIGEKSSDQWSDD